MSELIPRLDTTVAGFDKRLDALLAWEAVSDAGVLAAVTDIVNRVRAEGDAALLEFTQRFDGLDARDATHLEIPQQRLKAAHDGLPEAQRQALTTARDRVRAYHEKQKQDSWSYTEADGTVLGQQVTPLDRVGIYVPGGKASYPSSVLMNALPAKVAGVREIIMVVPTPRGEINELVFAAAYLAGVDRVFTIGGAQAVAALAYGT
ncbi:MAG: histidinol dehydrogenase, partial [Moraxellaceae bacterium]|nr:histidinol dehydrogenase [Moraxellaceae bacterium]